jgi:rSAM/selenodomain-associated transferase 1
MAATRIVILAKAPVAGSAKTRLIPLLGADGAARAAAQMLALTVRHALDADLGMPELCASPAPDHGAWRGHLPAGVLLSDQGGGDLGARLAAAAARVLAAGERVLLIGTDCPALDAPRLRQAAAALDGHDSVLFPARDGGYVLLGLKRSDPALFRDMPWSSSAVAGLTRRRIAELGWSLFVGDTLADVDEPADYRPDDWAS